MIHKRSQIRTRNKLREVSSCQFDKYISHMLDTTTTTTITMTTTTLTKSTTIETTTKINIIKPTNKQSLYSVQFQFHKKLISDHTSDQNRIRSRDSNRSGESKKKCIFISFPSTLDEQEKTLNLSGLRSLMLYILSTTYIDGSNLIHSSFISSVSVCFLHFGSEYV